MGGLFIAVVMFFPNGLAGVLEQHRVRIGEWWRKCAGRLRPTPAVPLQRENHS